MAESNEQTALYQAQTLGFNDALVADLTTLLADVTAINTAYGVLVAKLNADGGVTDEDYADVAAITTTLTVTTD